MPPADKIPVFINKNAKGAKVNVLKKWLHTHLDSYALLETESEQDMRQKLRSLLEAKTPIIAGAGGDGTLNVMAKEMVGHSSSLGIIPAGTMNVFAREMKIPVSSHEKAHKILQQKKPRSVDIFLANGTPFLQMCGVGFDAQVVKDTSWESKKKYGPLSYVKTALRLLSQKQPRFTLTDDEGKTHSGVFALIGNGALYGGALKLFPKAVCDDEVMDILLFQNISTEIFWQLARAALFHRIIPKSPHIQYLRTSSCFIDSEVPIPVEVDGDYLGETPLSLTLSPHKLSVIAPPKKETSLLTTKKTAKEKTKALSS